MCLKNLKAEAQSHQGSLHLNNDKAKLELNVKTKLDFCYFCPTPTYFVVKLDRLLTFCHHLMAFRKKIY